MNYRHIYMKIVMNAKELQKQGIRPKNPKDSRKNFPEQYFEFHHILPKSMFPKWGTRKSNIVPLTAKEHFFCHELLTKIYPNSYMWLALTYFSAISKNQKRKLTPRQYEIIAMAKRKEFECQFCGKLFPCCSLGRHEKSCDKNPNAKHIHFIFSEEHKRKIGEGNKGKKKGKPGKKHTENYKKRMSEMMRGNSNTKGMVWFTDGKNNIICFEGNQPEGFKKGCTTHRIITDEMREHYRQAAIKRHQDKKLKEF